MQAEPHSRFAVPLAELLADGRVELTEQVQLRSVSAPAPWEPAAVRVPGGGGAADGGDGE